MKKKSSVYQCLEFGTKLAYSGYLFNHAVYTYIYLYIRKVKKKEKFYYYYFIMYCVACLQLQN